MNYETEKADRHRQQAAPMQPEFDIYGYQTTAETLMRIAHDYEQVTQTLDSMRVKERRSED
jgi:hypothetical protein